MTSSLLHPPAHLPPSVALHLSQQAPLLLQNHSTSKLPISIPFLSTSETPETWAILENLLLSCLRTGDDKSARLCVEKLTERFGEENDRVMGLQGLFEEAVAENDADLEELMAEYDAILKENPTNMPIAKRRIALLRSTGKLEEATVALVAFLDSSPTDAEAWAELADLYLSQGLFSQTIYCLEEVLLIVPNAWNIHARLGEVIYMSAQVSGESGIEKLLVDSIRRFCRSIELCDDYLRGFYGLKLTTGRLLSLLPQNFKPASTVINPAAGEPAPPTLAYVQRLNEIATAKLAEIVRRSNAGEKGWDGYEQAEIIAARALLDKDVAKVEK
ncbi:hypothetical protein L228DRAFT_280050 [Xylona heveae TC161]|uniref:ER membrane protein complex subunit 2 n=1 Tax=Xylona heveae (strain CBS 132557 / TC161) TaxID=1328760 RepID=A0A165K2G9_XYLHT|nr:hypothetical protein L228DRAFT_280050 [Xylona heveae TC161]KZF26908.1 hypothetical protein L228DRAFT_280050 [Xylona heveae TC161]